MSPSIAVPTPKFPGSLDSWRELFRVYNSSSAVLAEGIHPYDTDLIIVPRDRSRAPDVWGENGFVTISSEILYYDSIEYESVPIEREIPPYSVSSDRQSYYLSEARQERVSGEILSSLRNGRESQVSSPRLIMENLFSSSPYPWTGTPTLSAPYSIVGRFLLGGVWYSFVTKSSGGVVGSSVEISQSGSGITSILMTELGVTFSGESEPEVVEIDYYSAPRRSEPVVMESLRVWTNDTEVVRNGSIISSEVASYDLETETGHLIIRWNGLPTRYITVSYKSGQVLKLKNCIRGYRTESSYHPAGTTISGFVMAEHHNNLAEAITSIEEYLLGLESQISSLEELPVECNPECPSGSFRYDVVEEDEDEDCAFSRESMLVRFNLESQDATENQIFFGDGESETNVNEVTHRYLPGTSFSPTVYFRNDRCEEFVTEGEEAESQEILFDLTLPEVPQIAVPDLEFDFGFPGIAVEEEAEAPTGLTPGGIDIGDLELPEEVGIIGPDLPSNIDIGDISIPPIEIPDIGFASISFPSISINPTQIFLSPTSISLVDDMPTQISVSPISLPTQITLTGISLPTSISVSGLDVNIPSQITLTGLSIPTSIQFTGITVPTQVQITGPELPTSIQVYGIPSVISFDTGNLEGALPQTISISVAVSTDNISGNCFKLVPCTT